MANEFGSFSVGSDSIKLGLDLSDWKAVNVEIKRVESLNKTVKDAEKAAEALAAKNKELARSYADLKAEADAVEKELIQLGNSFKSGGINVGQYQEKSQGLIVSLKEKKQALATTEGTSRQFGQGMLSASYAVQDFTSQLGTRGLAGALAAIQNNIPGILMGFSATAGVTAAISAASVATGLLYENWDKLARLWGSTDPAGTAKEIADQLEHYAKAAKELQEALTPVEKKTEELVKPLVTGKEPFADIQRRVVSGYAGVGQGLESFIDPKDKQAWEALQTHPGDFADPAKARTEILERAKKYRMEQAGTFVSELPKSRETRDLLRQMEKQAPGTFTRQFMTAMDLAEPEAQVAMKQEIGAEERAGKMMDTTRERMKVTEKKKKEMAEARRRVDEENEQDKKQKEADIARAGAERLAWEREQEATEGTAENRAKMAREKLARKKARAGTLAGQREEQKEGVEAEVGRQARQWTAQTGQRPTVGFMQEAAEQALPALDMGYSIAAAVQYGIFQANKKIGEDFNRGMRGMNQQHAGTAEKVHGMQFNVPPGYGSG